MFCFFFFLSFPHSSNRYLFLFSQDRLVHSLSHFGTWSLLQTAFLYICEAVCFSFHFLLLRWSVHPCYTLETGLKPVKIDLVFSANWSAPMQDDASEETAASSWIEWYFFQMPMTNTEVITQANSVFKIQAMLWCKPSCDIAYRM